MYNRQAFSGKRLLLLVYVDFLHDDVFVVYNKDCSQAYSSCGAFINITEKHIP